MTFSVLGGDDTGAIGIAISSSSPAVAARCVHLRAAVGGVASQNVTDPRLGPRLLDALEAGAEPPKALDGLVASTPDIEYRQLMVLDTAGRAATRSGAHVLGVHHEKIGSRVAVAGNLLARTEVVDAAAAAFERARGDLEERLLSALEAGARAGGEAGPLRSAGLAVVRDVPWPVTDLRVDWHDEPVAALRRLLEVWLPQRDDYVQRALRPAAAPSYGVPGDE